MTREQALPYVSFFLDDALSERDRSDMPSNAVLVGWQCGFEPMFVAVWSSLSDTQGNVDRLDYEDAEAIALDFLLERKWFGNGSRPADHVI